MTMFTEIWYRTERYGKLLICHNIWLFLFCGLGIGLHFILLSERGKAPEQQTAGKALTIMYLIVFIIQGIMVLSYVIYTYLNHKKYNEYQELTEKLGLKEREEKRSKVGFLYDSDDDIFEDMV